jgi:glycosyltransferase involved in cell wall biosynthesis
MSRGNKTLIILSPGFPKDETDTTCLPFLQQFVLELVNQFPDLRILILAFDYPFVRREYFWNNIRVIPFNGWKKGRVIKLLTWKLIVGKIRKTAKENEVIGLLSLWCGACAYLGSRFSKRNGVRHFCWIQGQDAKKGNRYVSLINPLPDELIAISDFIQSEFEKNYSIKPGLVVPAGISPIELSTRNAARNIDILGAGSLIPLKQYHVFIEIVRQIKQYLPEVQAVLCGKGPEETLLRQLIAQYELQDNVRLAGELPHAEVLQFMNQSKVFLHPSSYEGFSIACMEALYAGSHVLSFVQSMHYPIEHWHIFETKEQMAEKARKLLSSPDTDYSAVKTFTVADSVQKIMQLFD